MTIEFNTKEFKILYRTYFNHIIIKNEYKKSSAQEGWVIFSLPLFLEYATSFTSTIDNVTKHALRLIDPTVRSESK